MQAALKEPGACKGLCCASFSRPCRLLLTVLERRIQKIFRGFSPAFSMNGSIKTKPLQKTEAAKKPPQFLYVYPSAYQPTRWFVPMDITVAPLTRYISIYMGTPSWSPSKYTVI